MVEIEYTIVSRELFEAYFVCDLVRCKGSCCIEGVSGAPLTGDEAITIKENYPRFKEYIDKEHRLEIEKNGFALRDSDGDLVTPLVKSRQCAYSYYDEGGILKCAIEKAFLEGKSNFKKPISCHLYPVRITEYAKFDAVNYEKISICAPGRSCGEEKKVRLYRFLKEPLIRKYGKEWYKKVELAAEEIVKERDNR